MSKEIRIIEKGINSFKEMWYRYYSHIEMPYSDKEIQEFVDYNKSIIMAVDRALAQGLSEVQE